MSSQRPDLDTELAVEDLWDSKAEQDLVEDLRWEQHQWAQGRGGRARRRGVGRPLKGRGSFLRLLLEFATFGYVLLSLCITQTEGLVSCLG